MLPVTNSVLLGLFSLGIILLHQDLLLNLKGETGIDASLYSARKERYHEWEAGS